MIILNRGKYVIKKFPFTWFRVYEGKRLHSKFRYEASAVNFINMKEIQEINNNERLC